MDIIAKKPYEIHRKNGKGDPYKATTHERVGIPDWVAETELFKLAVQNGNIVVFDTKSDANIVGANDPIAEKKA